MKNQLSKKLCAFIIAIMFSSVSQFAFAQHCSNGHPCPPGRICVNHHCKSYKGDGWKASLFLNDETDLDFQIYPNPVNASSTISFSLQQSGKISLRIFDLNGRLIKTLADKLFEEGENELMWNAEDVNAGVYFLQFQSADFSETEKLIVSQ